MHITTLIAFLLPTLVSANPTPQIPGMGQPTTKPTIYLSICFTSGEPICPPSECGWTPIPLKEYTNIAYFAKGIKFWLDVGSVYNTPATALAVIADPSEPLEGIKTINMGGSEVTTNIDKGGASAPKGTVSGAATLDGEKFECVADRATVWGPRGSNGLKTSDCLTQYACTKV